MIHSAQELTHVFELELPVCSLHMLTLGQAIQTVIVKQVVVDPGPWLVHPSYFNPQ